MIDLTFTFNSTDLSSYLSTYKCKYEIENASSMTAMDGTEYVSTRVRPVVEFSLVPVSEAQATTIYSALSAISASTTFTDPNINSTRTLMMRVASSLDNVFGLKSINGNRYYKGGTITLRSRTVL